MRQAFFNRLKGELSVQQLTAYAALLVVVLLVAYPMVYLIEVALRVSAPNEPARYGLDNFSLVFSPRNIDTILNTIQLAVISTAIAIPCGFLAAWIIYRTDIPGKRFFERLFVLPYYVTPLVPALAWLALAAPQSGLINQIAARLGYDGPLVNISSLTGIAIVMAFTGGAVAFAIMGAAMQLLNPALEECSQVFGASKRQTLWRVTIPLMRPALLSATIFVFAEGLGAFAEPLILGATDNIQTISTRIYILAGSYPPAYGEAAALGISLLFIVVPLMFVYFRLLKNRDFATVTGKAYRMAAIETGRSRAGLFTLVLVYGFVAVILPVLMLVINSFQRLSTIYFSTKVWTLSNYVQVFNSADHWNSIVNSLILGVTTATTGLLLMGFVVWVIYRSPLPPRIGRFIEYVVMVPVAIPRLVFAFGLLWAWLQFPGKMYGTLWLLWLAYLTVFLPLGVRTIASVVFQLDKSLEEAAKVTGASRFYHLRTITVPLLKPGLIAAWILLFIVSVRELGSSILLIGPNSKVISPSIVEAYQVIGREQAATLAVIQLVVLLLALMVMLRFTRRETF
ncbi:MAG: iron ABC transporter permease [Mesorhizobium sp.]